MNKKERRLALATALQSATANTTIVEDLKVHHTLQSCMYNRRDVQRFCMLCLLCHNSVSTPESSNLLCCRIGLLCLSNVCLSFMLPPARCTSAAYSNSQQPSLSNFLLSNLVLQGNLSTPKTKTLVQALERWGVDQEEYALLILSEQSPNVELSARNVEKLKLNIVDKLNVYDILRADKIVMEDSAFKYIQELYGAAATAESAPEATAEVAPEAATAEVTAA